MSDDIIDYDSLFKKSVIPQALNRDNYPDARGKLHRGSWILEVSVPRPIRHLFQSTTVRKTAGKTEADYERRKRII